jgi:hypothetical protein
MPSIDYYLESGTYRTNNRLAPKTAVAILRQDASVDPNFKRLDVKHNFSDLLTPGASNVPLRGTTALLMMGRTDDLKENLQRAMNAPTNAKGVFVQDDYLVIFCVRRKSAAKTVACIAGLNQYWEGNADNAVGLLWTQVYPSPILNELDIFNGIMPLTMLQADNGLLDRANRVTARDDWG